MSSETSIPCLPPRKHATSARMATRSADRLAGGTCSGRCHGLKAHQAPFSAGNRTIHQRGFETSSREHCVAGAEAAAATVSCRDWECKYGRPQGPRRLAR